MNLFLIINMVGVLAVVAFYKSHRSEPGYVDYDWYHSYPADYLSTLQYCPTCEMPRPPRSSHCKDLGRCILRYDHFCPWIANAVGLQNHKYFILLIIYAMIASSLEQLVMVFLMINYDVKLHWSVLAFFIENGMVSLSIFLLVVLTLAFQAYNITTKEFYAWRNRPGASSSILIKYDKGFYSNFVQIMGPDPVSWWSPFSNEVILKEGYTFQ
uniref:Palmitoyltransferase n=1 Tax=Arcella intermedia TaxID=1963864 RepID=A0A6B2LFU5_9EUKA